MDIVENATLDNIPAHQLNQIQLLFIIHPCRSKPVRDTLKKLKKIIHLKNMTQTRLLKRQFFRATDRFMTKIPIVLYC